MTEYGPYGRLAAWVLQRKLLVGGIALVLAIVSAVAGLPPKVDSHLLSLLPPEEPVVAETRRLHKMENGANVVTLVFQNHAQEPTEAEDTAFHDYLDRVAIRFAEHPEVEFAVHRVDSDLAFRLGLLQLDPATTLEFANKLKGPVAIGTMLNNPALAAQFEKQFAPITKKIDNARKASMFQEQGRRGRVLVRPKGSSHDPHYSMALMRDVEAILEEVEPAANGADLVWIGGAYRHMDEDYRGVQSDMTWTTIASTVLVLFVIIVAFRSLRATVLVFAPLVLANLMNLAFVAFYVGHLNTYTSMAIAMLIGLGIDFAIHLVGRYREERAAGLPVEEAIPSAWDKAGPPCTTAAFTSAAGFLALAAGNFLGFSQLGVVLAMGLVLCLVSMLVLLPALIPILDPSPKVLLGTSTKPSPPSTSTYRLAPTLLMGVVVVTALVGATRLPLIDFNYDVSTFRREGLAYDELSQDEKQLAEESYSPVIVSFPTVEALVAGHRRLAEAIDSETELPHVATLISIESVLPSDQPARIAALDELVSVVNKPGFRQLALTPFRPIYDTLLPLVGFEVQPLSRDDLPAALQHILGTRNVSTHRVIMVPKGNMWDLREAEKLKNELHDVLGDQPFAGELPAAGALYTLVKRDIPVVGGLAVFLVFALTAIDVKRPVWIAGALFTLGAGLVWSGAALQLAGVRLSVINIVGIPILLGIGIDVVIHLLHRLVEEGPGGVRRALKTTGIAATVSTVTTVASFLSLTLAGSRGVQSLGIVVTVGLTTVFLASVVILPLAWAAGWRISGRAPGRALVDDDDDDD